MSFTSCFVYSGFHPLFQGFIPPYQAVESLSIVICWFIWSSMFPKLVMFFCHTIYLSTSNSHPGEPVMYFVFSMGKNCWTCAWAEKKPSCEPSHITANAVLHIRMSKNNIIMITRLEFNFRSGGWTAAGSRLEIHLHPLIFRPPHPYCFGMSFVFAL